MRNTIISLVSRSSGWQPSFSGLFQQLLAGGLRSGAHGAAGGNGLAGTGRTKVSGVGAGIGGVDGHILQGHVQNFRGNLRQGQTLAVAELGHRAVHHDLVVLQADIGKGLITLGVAAAVEAEAHAIGLVALYAGGNAPTLPAVEPMELFSRHVKALVIVDDGVAVLMAGTPVILVASLAEVLL